ncbi:MAG: ABC transporter substrate-binding protein [Rickettsiales bacterium]|jgi:phospholipid transport system substrate-binding protein|nr:ABC transporter substrate-binding protein [Rickettsiales bacterium]
MWKNRSIALFLWSALAIATMGGVLLMASVEAPKNFLRGFFTGLADVDRIRDPKLKESEFVAIVSKNVDLDWVANFILGRHSKNITNVQRKQFIELYSRYLASSYKSTLSIYGNNNYKFLAVEKQKENVFMVSTTVLFNERIVKNSFRVVEKDGKYHITDLVVEGISFISAKRADLNSMITSKGFDGFLRELKSINGQH